MQLKVDALFFEDLLELFNDTSACEANKTRDKWQPANPGMQLKVDALFFEDLLELFTDTSACEANRTRDK